MVSIVNDDSHEHEDRRAQTLPAAGGALSDVCRTGHQGVRKKGIESVPGGPRCDGLTIRLPGDFRVPIAAISSSPSAKSKMVVCCGRRSIFSARYNAPTFGCWISQRTTICATVQPYREPPSRKS